MGKVDRLVGSCLRKSFFPDEEIALKKARKLTHQYKGEKKFSVYWCTNCGGFHLTTSPRNKTEAKVDKHAELKKKYDDRGYEICQLGLKLSDYKETIAELRREVWAKDLRLQGANEEIQRLRACLALAPYVFDHAQPELEN